MAPDDKREDGGHGDSRRKARVSSGGLVGPERKRVDQKTDDPKREERHG